MKKISQFILKLIGWKSVGELPDIKKYIIIVAPHTSNWDLLVGLLGRFSMGVKIHFLIKKQVFFFPLGNILKALGGIPLDRAKKSNTVGQTVAIFKQQDGFILAVTPEGTRAHVKRWKEGFYHIACQAEVPIVMVGFNYATKEIIIREPFKPSGNIDTDFPLLLDFFKDKRGLYPKELPTYRPKDI